MRTADEGGRDLAVATKSGPADLVTRIDLEVERAVRTRVLAAFPHDGFAGEEYGLVNEDAPWRWWLDPIDGTTNFAHRLPFCSVSIALARANTTLAGVVMDATTGERFLAVRDAVATRGGRGLRLGQGHGLSGAVVATELQGARAWPGLFRLVDRLAETGATTRIMGSSALSLAYTAAGASEVCLISRPHPIDVSAGVLLVEVAGGRVVYEDGPDRTTPMLIAGSEKGVAEVRALLLA